MSRNCSLKVIKIFVADNLFYFSSHWHLLLDVDTKLIATGQWIMFHENSLVFSIGVDSRYSCFKLQVVCHLSLSYIPNKTKQPKIMRFGPIKKFAPLKTEAKTAGPKIRIFEACPNILSHKLPLSNL